MSFCTACGCERIGANHYCDGCGAEFGEPEPPEEAGAGSWPAALPRSGEWASGFSTPWSFTGASGPLPAGPATRPDVGIGLLDSLLAPPDPAGEAWPEVVAADDGVRRRPPGRFRWLAVATVAAVIIAGLGGAAAFELRHGHGRAAAAREGSAEVHARTPRVAPSAASGSSGVSGASGHAGTAVAATVTVAAAVGRNAALRPVLALLDRYFSAINQHDYAAYVQLLDPQALQRSPASAFYAGDGTTTDTGETLTGLADMSSGGAAGLAAAVTFTSHQQPADSPDHSDCDSWSITLYLVPQGAGYLISVPPAGYRASFAAC
ncbi:MAG TPA: hypothetical protein VIX15_11845 [Streptosporangiaceae bacterium]